MIGVTKRCTIIAKVCNDVGGPKFFIKQITNKMERIYNGIKCKFNSDSNLSNVIYEITFPNKKKYIGQTIQPLWKRMRGHCSDAIREGRQWNIPKCKALRKYKRFEVRVIQHCDTVDELNNREDEIIEEYKSKNQVLYNVASGGLNNCEYLGTECVVTDNNFNKLKEFKKVKDAREWIGTSGSVSKPGKYYVIRGMYYIIHMEDFVAHSVDNHREMLKKQQLEARVKRKKRRKEPISVTHFNVVQIDHRLNIVRVMDIKEIEKEFGMSVRYVLGKNSHHRAYGFYWLTEEFYKLHKKDIAKVLSGLDYIYKIDEDGNIIGEWRNIATAAKAEGKKEDTVSNNLLGLSRLSEPYFYIRSTDYEKVKHDIDYMRGRVQGQQNINTPVPVYEFDAGGKIVATYESKKSCARIIGTTVQRINKALMDGKPYRGRIYQNVNGV